MNERRTHIDLFSGVGGFALASNAAGFESRVFCESDPYCCKVLKRHWPDVPIIPDIRDFDGTRWRGADLLTGGFPCQPFSVCGERRGEEDDRHLWPEMFRVIKEARPDFVLAENVAGLINMALDDVLSQLEGEGYSTGTVVLPACAVNAPHRRDRVWILAHADSIRCEHPLERQDSLRQSISGNKQTTGRPQQDVADAEGKRCKPHAEKGVAQFYAPSGAEVLRGSGDGFNAGNWSIEPNVGRVAHGIPSRTHRLKALGNAIVPQVAYEILKLTTETTQQKETK